MHALSAIPTPDPAIGLIVIVGIVTAALFLSARWNRQEKQEAQTPLSGFFRIRRKKAGARALERRNSARHPRGSVIRGRIDHLEQICTIWGETTREAAIEAVAQIMRNELRKDDLVIEVEEAGGSAAFIIIAKSANEFEAAQIAHRLLRSISQAEVAGLPPMIELTASFGVAARRRDESVQEWHARASSALAAAQSAGEDTVITSSQWEEIALLPAPDTRVLALVEKKTA